MPKPNVGAEGSRSPLPGNTGSITGLNAEFEELSRLIQSGLSRFRGFLSSELAALTTVLEERRAEFLNCAPDLRVQHWQLAKRVEHIFRTDPRTKAIYDARQKRQPVTVAPLRYVGFSDDGQCRTFRFSPLPVVDDFGAFHIRVSLAFFGRDALSLQQGPAFSATILSELGQPADYDATGEDVEKFLSSHRPKASVRPHRSRFIPKPASAGEVQTSAAPSEAQ
jgi:hypothetical protein